jgi:putative ABC transport system permease protein
VPPDQKMGLTNAPVRRVAGSPWHWLAESVGLALGTIRANKLRSGLTVLGVIIGVAAIIGILSLVHGLNTEVSRQIRGLGSNVFYVQKFPAVRMGRMPRSIWQRKDLTVEDAEALQEACPLVEVTNSERWTFRQVRYRDEVTKVLPIIGTTERWIYTNNAELAAGRFLDAGDVRRRRHTCVLGSEVAESLFGSMEAVGKEVSIAGHRGIVVGVLQPRGKILGQSQDDGVIIPITTLGKLAGRRRSIAIEVRVRRPEELQRATDEVRSVLRRRRKVQPNEPDDFEIITQDSLLDVYKRVTGAAFGAMVAVAGISLVVGGIGIANVMLVSVTERTREIGIRKAVGATRAVVLWQFLVESMILSLVGGVVGMALGASLALFVAAVTPLSAAVPPWAFPLAFIFSSAVGIISGGYPASRAARLHPVEALSYE